MQRKFVFLNTGCLFLCLVLLAGCKAQSKIGGDRGGKYPYDADNANRYVIPVSQAVKYQQGFMETRKEIGRLIQNPGYLEKNFNIPNGESFSKDALLLLLNQKDAVGVRMYYGKDEKGAVRLILMPVRKDGSVIYAKLKPVLRRQAMRASDLAAGQPAAARAMMEAEAVETGQTCPPCILETISIDF